VQQGPLSLITTQGSGGSIALSPMHQTAQTHSQSSNSSGNHAAYYTRRDQSPSSLSQRPDHQRGTHAQVKGNTQAPYT
jgi:hypothetical protein